MSGNLLLRSKMLILRMKSQTRSWSHEIQDWAREGQEHPGSEGAWMQEKQNQGWEPLQGEKRSAAENGGSWPLPFLCFKLSWTAPCHQLGWKAPVIPLDNQHVFLCFHATLQCRWLWERWWPCWRSPKLRSLSVPLQWPWPCKQSRLESLSSPHSTKPWKHDCWLAGKDFFNFAGCTWKWAKALLPSSACFENFLYLGIIPVAFFGWKALKSAKFWAG